MPYRHTTAVCQQRPTDLHLLQSWTTTNPTDDQHLSWTPATASRLLTAAPGATDRGNLSRDGYGRKRIPTSTNHTTASRLLTESYSRCNRPGATPDRSRTDGAPLQVYVSPGAGGRENPGPGGEGRGDVGPLGGERIFLQLLRDYETMRLHRGCSPSVQHTGSYFRLLPRATPGATDRELLPVVFVSFHESHDCIAAAHRELLPVQQTGSYSRSVKTNYRAATQRSSGSYFKIWPDFLGLMGGVWGAPGARESLQKCGRICKFMQDASA